MTANPKSLLRPPPPDGFQTWLDYAVAHMDTLTPHLDQYATIGENESLPFDRDDMRAAVLQELDELRQSAKVADTFPALFRQSVGIVSLD